MGVVEGAAETTASLLKVVSGYWSDKIRKRKPFILLGYSFSSLMKPLFAFANVWGLVLFLRVIERIGKGLRTAPRDALVAESSDAEVRGRAYGYQRAMDGIGSTLGALGAFFLLPIWGYRKIFLFTLVPGLLTIMIILLIQEKRGALEGDVLKTSMKMHYEKLPQNLNLLILSSTIFTLGNFGYAFIMLKGQTVGLPDNMVLLLYVLFYLVFTICSIPFGMLSDWFGRRPVLMLGYLVFAMVSVLLMFTSTSFGVLFAFTLFGVYSAMIDGAQRAFVVDLAPDQFKATALGTFHTAIGLVALPGGFIAGVLWDMYSPTTTFTFGLVLAIAAMIILLFVEDDRRFTNQRI